MFEEMLTMVRDRVDPSLWDALVSLMQALEGHQAVGYKDKVIALYMEGNNLDQDTLVDRVRGILDSQVEALLDQMGIRLDTTATTMSTLADIIRTLEFKPSDLDSEALAALDQSEDAQEVLCDVLAVYLSLESVELIEVVSEVSDNTVAAMREVLEANVSYDEEGEVGVSEVVASLHSLQSQLGGEPTVALESLHSGTAPGVSMDLLVKDSYGRLSVLPEERMVDELLAFSILAKVPEKARRVSVLTHLEDMIDDPLKYQKAFKRLNKLLGIGT